MTYAHVQAKFAEIKEQTEIWAVREASELSNRTAPTLFLINTVSLFADALEIYCDAEFPGWNSGHEKRLAEILAKVESRLLDARKCEELHVRRNVCAHDFGARCDWAELRAGVAHIEGELRHLGILR